MTDGLFSESKEVLGGYHIIDVEDLVADRDWAACIPSPTFGTGEARPLVVLPNE